MTHKLIICLMLMSLVSCAFLEDIHKKIAGEPVIYITNGIFISIQGGNDLNTGTNRLSPVRTLSAGINNAIAFGYQNIYVTADVYTNGDGLNSSEFGILITNNDLNFYGGCDQLFSINRAGYSELDGNTNLKRIILIRSATNILLDRFVVREGNGITFDGAGCYISNALDISIRHCVFLNNFTSGMYGGGVAVDYGSSNISIQSTSFASNRSREGAGFFSQRSSQILISNCLFDNNISYSGYGGGLYFYLTTDIIIEDCRIINNFCSSWGGGIIINASTNFNVRNSAIVSNQANGGSALYFINSAVAEVLSCVMTNNYSAVLAVIIVNAGISNFILSNCMISACTNNAAYGIYETSELANHILIKNVFLTNSLLGLYRDISGLTVPCNAGWTNINITSYSGAALAVDNTVQ